MTQNRTHAQGKAASAATEGKTSGGQSRNTQRSPVGAAGNQAVQRLLNPALPPFIQRKCAACAAAEEEDEHGVQTKLELGRPDDHYEREADRLADQISRGNGAAAPNRSGTSGKAFTPIASALLQGKAVKATRGGGAGAEHVANLTTNPGPGAPMQGALRERIEPVLGVNLSAVRVHDDAEAQRAAASIGAKAFTHGSDIYLGRGQHADDLALMAHEATHVAQQGAGATRVQRECDPNVSSCLDEPVCADASVDPEAGGSCSVLGPAEVEHGPGYDPCQVNVGSLSNYELLAEYASALAVVSQGRDASGYFDYRNLQRRLIQERDRRVDLGHAWLATMPGAIPDPLYRIVDGPMGTFQVLAAPGAMVAGAPENATASPFMTWDQFEHFLSSRNIERIDENTYRMRIAAREPSAPLMWPSFMDIGVSGGISGPDDSDLPFMYSNPLSGRGSLFPVSPFERGPGTTLAPFEGTALPEVFNSPPRPGTPAYMLEDALSNPAAMDPERARLMVEMIRAYRRAAGVPPRIDPGVIANLDGDYRARGLRAPSSAPGGDAVSGGTVALAQTDIPNLSGNFPGASAEALPPHLRGTPGTTGGDIFIPANPTAVNHAEHVALEALRSRIDGALERGDLTRAGMRGRTVFLMVEQEPCSSCAAGSASADATAGVIEQFARRYPELTIEVRSMRTSRSYIYRGGVLLNPSGATSPVVAPELPPIMLEGEPRLPPLGVGRGLALGGGVGGGIAIATSAGAMFLDDADHPDWEQELLLSGALGTGSGLTGTATELGIVRASEHMMLRSALGGTATRMTPGLATGLGRFGGGAAGAVFIEGISMGLLEEREHSGLEIGTRTARSAALGGGSIWAGAAAGTAVGGPVGFLVGLVIGGALYYVGDKLVPGGREDWDAIEAGCAPLPTVERWRAATAPPPRRPMFWHTCFVASTLITMGDGSFKAIATLAVGEEVLSYNDITGLFEVRLVEKVHAFQPAPHLLLQFDNGSEMRVTPMHKLSTPDGWKKAGELNVGTEVYEHPRPGVGKGGSLERTTLLAIDPRPASESVYDLTVATTHTYFAETVLVHNKI